MAKDSKKNEKLEDLITERVIGVLGKSSPIKRIRSSHILSGFIGISGIALLFLGIEKIFGDLPGFVLIIIGLILLTISGALFKALGQ